MIIKNRKEFNLEMHIICEDCTCENAFVQPFEEAKAVGNYVEKRNQHLIQVIKGLYNNTCICIDTDTALVEIMQNKSRCSGNVAEFVLFIF